MHAATHDKPRTSPVRLLDRKKEPDGEVPFTLLLDPKLGDRELRLYVILLHYQTHNEAHPPIPELAHIIQKDRNYIDRGLRNLTQLGYVSAEQSGPYVVYSIVPLDEVRPLNERRGSMRDDFDRLWLIWPFKWDQAQSWGYFRTRLRPEPALVDRMERAIHLQYDGIPGDQIRFAGTFLKWLQNQRWELEPSVVRAQWQTFKQPEALRIRATGKLCTKCEKRRTLDGETVCPPCQMGR